MPFNPMCCPNPIHNDDPNVNAGMDIGQYAKVNAKGDIVYVANTWWCHDCMTGFTFIDGVSKLIKAKDLR